MALYTIGDLHLSLGSNKPMDIFGDRWQNYVEKIRLGFSALTEDDTTVLCGDLSWGMSLEESLLDFRFIHALPGRKIILKGNHDYWWNTASKMQRFFADNGLDSIEILHNNCLFYNGTALCGTRGWFYELDNEGTHNGKMLAREAGRLETSLKAAGDAEKICFLHYPPLYQGYECPEILRLLQRYGVGECYFGHLHGAAQKRALEGLWKAIILSAGAALGTSLLVLGFASEFSACFDSDPAVIEQSAAFLRVTVWSYPLFATVGPLIGFIRGTGNVEASLVVGGVAQLCCRVPASFLFSRWMGFPGVGVAVLVGPLVSVSIYLWYILTRRWHRGLARVARL